MTNLILILGLAAILISGTVAADQIAFADDDDHEKECKEDLEDFIKKTNKLIDKKKLSEEKGQPLIILVEELIENDCGTIKEIDEVKVLVESYDLKKKDSRKLIDELEDAKKEIKKAIKKAEKNTLEYKCAKLLNKNHLSLHGFFCAVIFALQDSIADLQTQIDTMQLTPGPQGPPGPEGPPGDDTIDNLSCLPGEIVKWDGSSWVCGEDESGGGTTDGPFSSIKLIPQPESIPPPSMCSASTAGTIYYKLGSVDEPDQFCVCADKDGQGNHQYIELLNDDLC